MLDIVAKDLRIDHIEMRRRNLVTAEEQPYSVATIQPTDAKDQYDSGDYRTTLDRVLKEIDWPDSMLQGAD
jgi:carbon-monoxide dehydrogenase large subunit